MLRALVGVLRVSTEELVSRLGGDLRAFVARRVAADHVDDVLQDVLLKIHRGLPSVTDPARVFGWVHQVARNVVTDHHRRGRREVSLDVDGLVDEPEAAGDEEAVRATVGRWLVSAIQDLPPRHREALELVELGGLGQRELAERLGLSPSGARTRVQRARAALRESIERCCEIELDRRGAVIECRAPEACC